jgi:hypothetical protein
MSYDDATRRLARLLQARATQSTGSAVASVSQEAQRGVDAHATRTDNPHAVTAAQAGAEPDLGNPAADGYVLSSSAAGVRAWVPDSGGGGGLTIEEVDGSPTVAATKLVLPNGTLGVVGTVATYTPAGGGGGGNVSAGTAGADIPGLAGSADRAGIGGATFADEYDTTTTGLTASSAPAQIDSHTTFPSFLYIRTTDATERFFYRSFSPAGDFDVRCQFDLGTGDSAPPGQQFGLIIANADNSLRVLVNVQPANALILSYTFSGSYAARAEQLGVNGWVMHYLRITRVGTTITAYTSDNGRVWARVGAGAFALTVAQVGFRTGNTSLEVAVDWLRAA